MAGALETWYDKLLILLQKISHDHLKCIDESYFDKLLTCITQEISLETDTRGVGSIAAWFFDNVNLWPELKNDPTVAGFLLRLLGVYCKTSELQFESFLASGVVSFLDAGLGSHKSSSLRCNYLATLSNLASHNLGRQWVMKEEKWKEAVKMATTDQSLYVQRQATFLIRLLLKEEKNEPDFTRTVLHEIIDPILHELEEISEKTDTAVQSVMSLHFRLLDALAEDCIELEDANLVPKLLVQEFSFDERLKKCLEGTYPPLFVAVTYGTILLTALPSENPENEEHPNVTKLLEMLKTVIRGGHVRLLMKLSRTCHILWLKLQIRRKNASMKTEMHFYVTLLMPLLVSLRKCAHHKLLDMYVNKLLDMTSEETFRLAYLARDEIRKYTPIFISEKATYAIYALMSYHRLLDHEKTVVLFQTFVWVLKNFVPTTCEYDKDPEISEIVEARQLCLTLNTLLNAVLDALCTITEECKVAWSEAFEGLCLLSLSHWLLKTPELPSKTTVLTLRMVRLAIARFMPPNLALLVDNFKDSSVEAVAPMLVQRLHDPNWEVRDSALEVIATIADLCHMKFPGFQDLLLDLKIYPLVVSILEGDAEGYVRASALKALISVVPVSRIWETCLIQHEIPRLILGILRTDTEGIVRREAALLITKLLRHERLPGNLLEEACETMLRVTTSDLHWEVKLNSLDFWSQVIECRLQEQGMVDGVFPSCTFSQNKKIIYLTEPEIQTRLNKVLEELSKLGCLNALLMSSTDDCDSCVVLKSSKVICNLVSLLQKHNAMPVHADEAKKRKCCFHMEAKPCKVLMNGTDENCESLHQNISFAGVIENIVNASDISLLAGVCGDRVQNSSYCGKEKVDFVDVETFLNHIQDHGLSGISDVGSLSEQHVATDELSSLLDSVLAISNDVAESNIPDCY